MSSRFKGLLLMIACSFLISFGPLMYRNFQDIEVLEVVFLRSVALIIYMTFYLSFKYKTKIIGNIKSIGFMGVLASFVFCSAQASYLVALKYTSVANATFTLCVVPFITAVLAYFFIKESISRTTAITMIFALVGVIIIIIGGFEGSGLKGILFALYTAFALASFAVILRANRTIDMLPTLMVTAVFMALIGGLGGSFTNAIPFTDVILCLIWGIALQGFAHSLMIRATRLILSAEVTLFMLLEFTIGPFWVWLFMNEVPTSTSLIGGSVIIMSVTILTGTELKQTFKINREPT